MRFQLIDRVIEQSAERVLAVKNVTAAEEYLADHFPTFPVLPGVMMLETLVQAGRLLVEGRDAYIADRPLVLTEVRNVRYGNMVRPGQTLTVEVTLRGPATAGVYGGPQWDLQGIGKVNDQVAVQGRFTLAPL
ncbi:MAG: 3-hydroxyacyl-ACP dehydratase FabZ family protein [Phycisphaeraceae bacterium]